MVFFLECVTVEFSDVMNLAWTFEALVQTDLSNENVIYFTATGPPIFNSPFV